MFRTLKNVIAKHSYASLAASIALLAPAYPAFSQATFEYSYPGTINGRSVVESLNDGIFGDEVSYIDGGIGFRTTDVVASTTVKLPLQFGRRMVPHTDVMGDLGRIEQDKKILILGTQWKPDIPSIIGVYPTRDGLYTGAKPRCTGGNLAPMAISVPSNPPILPYNFWYGVEVNIPGHPAQKLWPLTPGSDVPTDGRTYKFSTISRWRVSCLSQLKNGPGEGYVVTLLDGSQYFFDWLALRPIKSFTTPYATENRAEMYFFATKAVDRFGNTITYEYDPANPTHLIRMTASDGAVIALNYGTDGRLAEVVNGSQTWRYHYALMGGREELQYVVLPDGSRWEYEIPQYLYGNQFSQFGINCDFRPHNMTMSGDSAVFRQTFKHPSGATGEFTYKYLAQGYNNVASGVCLEHAPFTTLVGRVKAFKYFSLISKVIRGPGLPEKTWSLSYAPSWSYESECTNGCPNTATTTVTSNDGRVESYVFGNDFKNNANQLISHTISKGGQPLRKTAYKYVDSMEGQPFPDYITGPVGEALVDTLDNPLLRRNRPRKETEIYQDGVVFKSIVGAFDSAARPLSVTESSTPSP